jgi:hypothetical protein
MNPHHPSRDHHPHYAHSLSLLDVTRACKEKAANGKPISVKACLAALFGLATERAHITTAIARWAAQLPGAALSGSDMLPTVPKPAHEKRHSATPEPALPFVSGADTPSFLEQNVIASFHAPLVPEAPKAATSFAPASMQKYGDPVITGPGAMPAAIFAGMTQWLPPRPLGTGIAPAIPATNYQLCAPTFASAADMPFAAEPWVNTVATSLPVPGNKPGIVMNTTLPQPQALSMRSLADGRDNAHDLAFNGLTMSAPAKQTPNVATSMALPQLNRNTDKGIINTHPLTAGDFSAFTRLWPGNMKRYLAELPQAALTGNDLRLSPLTDMLQTWRATPPTGAPLLSSFAGMPELPGAIEAFSNSQRHLPQVEVPELPKHITHGTDMSLAAMRQSPGQHTTSYSVQSVVNHLHVTTQAPAQPPIDVEQAAMKALVGAAADVYAFPTV